MKTCQCTQCGSADFNREGTEFLRCSHCNSLFKMIEPAEKKGPTKVIIKNGANVVFGKNSNVIINGELIIENGANVSFLGQIEIIETSSPQEIENAKQKLKLL